MSEHQICIYEGRQMSITMSFVVPNSQLKVFSTALGKEGLTGEVVDLHNGHSRIIVAISSPRSMGICHKAMMQASEAHGMRFVNHGAQKEDVP